MSFKLSKRQIYSKSLALLLGLGLTISLLTGLALAREGKPGLIDPEVSPPGSIEIQTVGDQIYWLILDPAESIDEILPQLQDFLTKLKADGVIVAFDDYPQASAPNAVSGLQVFASSDALETLRRLPGVLEVTTELPPPPPDAGELVALAASGSITGQITDAGTGQALQSPLITVRIYDGVSFALLDDNIPVNASGVYSSTISAPYDKVKVRAVDDNLLGLGKMYISEWYDDKPFFSEATVVPLSGGVQANKNIALARGGRITGTLTFAGGAPAVGVNVVARNAATRVNEGTDQSNANGVFDISGLRSGSYKLNFFGGDVLGEEWYQDKTDIDSATPVNVTAGSTTMVNAQLTQGGVITGALTATGSGTPIPEIDVTVIDTSGKVVGSGKAGTNGRYRVGGLASGSYKVVFAAKPFAPVVPISIPIPLEFEKQYYNSKTTLASANSVNVTVGSVTPNINATLVPTNSGIIGGKLTRDGGSPLVAGDNGQITIRDSEIEGISALGANISGNGAQINYLVNNVKAGQYKVRFLVLSSSGVEAASEYYNDKTDFSSADVVTVQSNQATQNIDGDLSVGLSAIGSISGTLTNNGNPISGTVQVLAYKTDKSSFSRRDTTAVNGVYQIDGLEPGTYLVSFSQFPSATTWYNGKTSRVNADQVTVTANNTTSAVNGTLNDLGACISGKILDTSGQGIPFASFQVYDSGNNSIYFWEGRFGTRFTRSGTADEDGGYVACGLAAGAYNITVADGESGSVSVNTGEDKSGVNVNVLVKIYLPVVLKN